METVLTLTEVPLASLSISELNVRKSNLTEDIKALAADIHAHGLKQNLVVVPSEVAGRYQVVAGGRRLQALFHLVDEGLLEFGAPIPVRVEAVEEGRPTSLSENLHRLAMNPADEFVAYRTIVDDHRTLDDPVAYCAGRFGVSREHVEGRLRLAALAPEILDVLREGRLTVASAKAYASFADHKLQLAVFATEERKTWGTKHDPRGVRDALKLKTLPVSCPQAIYVGLDAYRDAGGRIELEMFMEADGSERIVDMGLLDKLARTKMAADLPAAVARDGFGDGLLVQGLGAYPAWPKTPTGTVRDHTYKLDPATLSPAEREASTGVYKLATDGTGLVFEGRFKPADPQGAAGAQRDWAAEQRERNRRDAIAARAAKLALPDLVGTALDGLLVEDDEDWLEEAQDEDAFFFHVRIRLTADQVAAHRAEAELAIAREEAADQEEEASAKPAEKEAIDA